MVDIHSHILYGILDSPKDVETSIEIAKQYVNMGFSYVVSTPHFNPASVNIEIFKEECDAKYKELENKLFEQNIALPIIPGAEVMLCPDLLDIENIHDLCIKNTNYLLIEFPWHYFPLWAETVLFEIGLKNIIPILAHPERNEEIFRNYDKFLKLIDAGLFTQINAISLFDSSTRKRLKWLFDEDAVSFIATDTHRPGDRMSCINKAISILKRKIGTIRTERIIDNSSLVISNKSI